DEPQAGGGIARRLLALGGGDVDASRLRPRLDLVAERLLRLAPIAVERGGELAARERVGPLPRRPARVRHDGGAIVLQALEERLPLGIERGGVGLVAGIEVLEV